MVFFLLMFYVFFQVNIFQLVLQVTTIIHPLRLYILGRRDKSQPESNVFNREEVIAPL